MGRLTEKLQKAQEKRFHPCVACDYTHMCRSCDFKRYLDLEEQGRLVEVIKCKDCTEYNPWGFKEGLGWCEEFDRVTIDDDYCSNAKLAELKGTEE
jgi:hypothetical protein